MGCFSHGGTQGPWHSRVLSSIAYPNPTAADGFENGDGLEEYHCACIQIQAAYDAGQHNNQVAPPSMETAIGLADQPTIGEKIK